MNKKIHKIILELTDNEKHELSHMCYCAVRYIEHLYLCTPAKITPEVIEQIKEKIRFSNNVRAILGDNRSVESEIEVFLELYNLRVRGLI